MKDSEFIELLNLYLDHEISATDAARIEEEVQQNPARRRLYQQYCRVQKACTLLAKDYFEQAETAGSTADRRIAAFQPRRTWGLGVYLGGLAAAAACVAVVFVSRSGNLLPATDAANSVAIQHPAKFVPAAANVQGMSVDSSANRMIAQTVTVASPRNELQPVFTASRLMIGKNNADAGLATTELQARFDWMRDLQMSPIQRIPADELRFDAKAAQKSNPRIFGPGRAQDDVQQAAFQFQR